MSFFTLNKIAIMKSFIFLLGFFLEDAPNMPEGMKHAHSRPHSGRNGTTQNSKLIESLAKNASCAKPNVYMGNIILQKNHPHYSKNSGRMEPPCPPPITAERREIKSDANKEELAYTIQESARSGRSSSRDRIFVQNPERLMMPKTLGNMASTVALCPSNTNPPGFNNREIVPHHYFMNTGPPQVGSSLVVADFRDTIELKNDPSLPVAALYAQTLLSLQSK